MPRHPQPKSRRQRAPLARGAATRERLLDAAYVLFAEKGYAATSTAPAPMRMFSPVRASGKCAP